MVVTSIQYWRIIDKNLQDHLQVFTVVLKAITLDVITVGDIGKDLGLRSVLDSSYFRLKHSRSSKMCFRLKHSGPLVSNLQLVFQTEAHRDDVTTTGVIRGVPDLQDLPGWVQTAQSSVMSAHVLSGMSDGPC